MFSSKLRLVPWRNREEWVEVYEDAYSSDNTRRAKACQTMELWLVLRRDVPPGVECTLNILSAILEERSQNSRQLQLLLSTAVLRVVNMVCDNARQSDRSTIYSIAKSYNLPDWIVNLRHDVSHGSVLPDVSTLKRAAVCLLDWLREYYWEVEKDEIKDVVLKRSRKEACDDNVKFYLQKYQELMRLLNTEGDIRIKQIDKQDIVFTLLDVNRKSGLQCAIECLPWMRHSRDSFASEIPRDKIPGMKISVFLSLMLNQLQDYLTKTSFWQVDVLPLLIDEIRSNFKLYESMDTMRKDWELMIQKLNKNQVLGKLMVEMSDEVYVNDESCNAWFNEICKSVAKRHLTDELRTELSSGVSLSSDSFQQAVAESVMLKKRLAVAPDSNETIVTSKLFGRVEKKNIALRNSIRLKHPVNYVVDGCTALQVIKKVSSHPNKRTLENLSYLFHIVNPSLSEKKREALRDLIMIRLGQKAVSKHKQIYSIKTLADIPKDACRMTNKVMNTRAKLNSEVLCKLHNPQKEVHEAERPSHIFRSGWDFSMCPLGVIPWQTLQYFHKPYETNKHVHNKIFPFV